MSVDDAKSTGPPHRHRRVGIWAVVLLWALAMAPLSCWGLPSSSRDALLFGGDAPWDASRYAATTDVAARRTRERGADTDADPLDVGNHIVELTADDAGRAAILRRFRLFSRQPDEMITFMALQRMNPRALDFDPKLYQYGGAYIYLIGGLISVASLLGITTLTGDVAVYLARPELFASFYMIGRIVSLFFGGLTLMAVFTLARLAAGRGAGWWALVLTASCPVFITMALEAKPHMASTCAILWAALAALRFHSGGGTRAAMKFGVLAGAAFALVLTGVVAAALAPVLALGGLKNARRRRRLVAALGLAAAVYLVTNPYVPYHLLFNRGALGNNIGNSTGMYQVGRIGAGARRAGELMVESCGPIVLLLGLVGGILIGRVKPRQTAVVALPGLAMLLICIAIGAGKPAEFARFLLLPAVLVALAAGITMQRAAMRWRAAIRPLAALVVAGWIFLPGGPIAYLRSFATDAWSDRETRLSAARYIREHAAGTDDIGVPQFQEPAPYAAPPIDFAHRRVRLLPAQKPGPDELADLPAWIVACADDSSVFDGVWWARRYRLAARYPRDDRRLSRISWANKPAFVYRRAE